MSESRSCSKCGGNTEVGWLTDQMRTGITFARWVKGIPDTSFFAAFKTPQNASPILSYCCVDCGYLELYVPRSSP
jgi:predicted nucleic-acid-binding Zn-ribbon protein